MQAIDINAWLFFLGSDASICEADLVVLMSGSNKEPQT